MDPITLALVAGGAWLLMRGRNTTTTADNTATQSPAEEKKQEILDQYLESAESGEYAEPHMTTPLQESEPVTPPPTDPVQEAGKHAEQVAEAGGQAIDAIGRKVAEGYKWMQAQTNFRYGERR